MSMGLEDETRPWPKTRKSDRRATKDVNEKVVSDKYCCFCGQKIVGKRFRVSEDKVQCFRCWNE